MFTHQQQYHIAHNTYVGSPTGRKRFGNIKEEEEEAIILYIGENICCFKIPMVNVILSRTSFRIELKLTRKYY